MFLILLLGAGIMWWWHSGHAWEYRGVLQLHRLQKTRYKGPLWPWTSR